MRLSLYWRGREGSANIFTCLNNIQKLYKQKTETRQRLAEEVTWLRSPKDLPCYEGRFWTSKLLDEFCPKLNIACYECAALHISVSLYLFVELLLDVHEVFGRVDVVFTLHAVVVEIKGRISMLNPSSGTLR